MTDIIIEQLPKYELMQDSGFEWIGDIPSSWNLLSVKQIYRLVMEESGKNHSLELLSVYSDIGVRPRAELEEKGNKASSTDGYWLVRKGDFVVNKLLAWMGGLGLSEYDGVTSPAYDVLRPRKEICGSYFNYLFRSPACTSELKKHSRGIMDMRLRLYFDKFGVVKVPFPSLKEQKAISTFLDKKTSKIDEAIAIKQKQIELLKERKQIITQQAVTQGLNPDVPMKDSGVDWIGCIPEHWNVKRLKYVLEERNERSKTGEEPLFMVSQVHGLVIRADYHEKAEVAASNIDSKIVYKNDLVFNKLKAHLGVFFKSNIDFKGLVSPDYAVYKSKAYISDMKILELLFRHPSYIEQFVIRATGIVEGLIRLYTSELFDIAVPIAPESEQREIISFVESESLNYDQAIAIQVQQIEKLQEYKTTLINSVVTGKIKVPGVV
ncbi:restriction endonuclease subunit S [Vibrio tasmaniensis]|uniref:restriction endonuclease subunit S n=1 Tax=Vibrio tasmaniensis TaxID=212663 RepID=UPI000C842ECE|nr:restriction endonuclease subunit S [Vibrio tasmaniensis]PML45561.1 restriction endonuclease subunit S [Vibrio tasmaniensis]